jgi:low temperature requirement protein LtrA
MPWETIREFRRWFWRPPRAHGEVILDRRVSYLELLYDLVYVAVISQAAMQLASDISAQRFLEFAVVFGLIWIAWVNGSLYLELHGREDGRTRSFVFLQMGILAVLAVFTGSAATESGAQFALTYVAFLAVLVWLWNSVRRLDAPDVARVTKQYSVGLFVAAALILASAFLPPDMRLLVWAAFVVLWVGAMLALSIRSRSFSIGLTPTHSMVERFGLFTIIVLGEVVIGVVDGISHAEQDAITVGTGILALGIGLGFWWIYFDITGGKVPRNEGRAIATWILTHLPITLAIAAAGASMVGLIEHAHDPVAPEATVWLLAGSVALVLVGQVVNAWALEDAQRVAVVYRPLALAMCAAAVVALAMALARPAPWVLVLALGLLLTLLWFFAVGKFIRAGAWPPTA